MQEFHNQAETYEVTFAGGEYNSYFFKTEKKDDNENNEEINISIFNNKKSLFNRLPSNQLDY